MAPLPAPAEKPSHRVSDSQSHAKVRPPTQVAVFCAALWPNLQPALTLRQGKTILAIGKLLGHRSPETTLKYTHLADTMVHEAAETVGAVLEG